MRASIPYTMKGKIYYIELGANELKSSHWRIPSCFYIAVTAGRAIFDVGEETYEMLPQTEFNMPAGAMVHCYEISEDFQLRAFIYPQGLLERAMRLIDTKWLEWTGRHPYYRHTADERSQRTWRELLQWMDLAQTLFSPISKILFPPLQQENFVEGFWLWNLGTIQDKVEASMPQGRSQSIYRRFLKLVSGNYMHDHSVEAYARELNVTSRYLSHIVGEQTQGRTPKEIIDRRLLIEIKDLLSTTDLTVSQIADKLGFHDQSSLSRYFRHRIGMYPSAYRQSLHHK